MRCKKKNGEIESSTVNVVLRPIDWHIHVYEYIQIHKYAYICTYIHIYIFFVYKRSEIFESVVKPPYRIFQNKNFCHRIAHLIHWAIYSSIHIYMYLYIKYIWYCPRQRLFFRRSLCKTNRPFFARCTHAREKNIASNIKKNKDAR